MGNQCKWSMNDDTEKGKKIKRYCYSWIGNNRNPFCSPIFSFPPAPYFVVDNTTCSIHLQWFTFLSQYINCFLSKCRFPDSVMDFNDSLIRSSWSSSHFYYIIMWIMGEKCASTRCPLFALNFFRRRCGEKILV